MENANTGFKQKLKDCLELFAIFFKIGLFTFGGGYAMISVISHEVVEKKKFISSEEFSDVVAIAESTPGPIAINSATYIGYRKAGVLGSIFASIGVGLPSLIIIYLISLFFAKILENPIVNSAFLGIQCCVATLIVSAGIKLTKNVKKNYISVILIALSFILLTVVDLLKLNVSTIFFVIAGAILGIAIYYRPKKSVNNGPIGQDLLNNDENSQANNQVNDEILQPRPAKKLYKIIIPIVVLALVLLVMFFFGGIYQLFAKEAIENLSSSGFYQGFLKVCALFSSFFKIGLFSFGGGYGMLPLMLEETVGRNWITEAEFANFLAVAESTPGPIAINMATYVGSTQGGLIGSIFATIGVMMPSIIVILIIVALLKNFLQYNGVRCAFNGMKPVICGMILQTGILLGLTNIFPNIESFNFEGFKWQALVITAIIVGITIGRKFIKKKNLFTKLINSPIFLIIISAILGIIFM